MISLSLFTPDLDLYDAAWPIWTYQAQLPPAKFIHDEKDRRGTAVSSLVSGGCIISGAVVRHSLLFSGVKINSYASVEDAVVQVDDVVADGERGAGLAERPVRRVLRRLLVPQPVGQVGRRVAGTHVEWT